MAKQCLANLRIFQKLCQKEKQTVNAIYTTDNYTDIFERDLAEANNSIIISSPTITAEKIERFIQILKPRQEAGVKVNIILTNQKALHRN